MNELEVDNPEIIIDKLSNNNKTFLNELIGNSKIGNKILYTVFDFLDENVESLQSLDLWIDGEITQIIEQLNTNNTIKLIDLFVQLKQYKLNHVSLSNMDMEKIITKLKRDVAILNKKVSQPSKYINTKQFEDRFGLTRLQQKGLRGKIHDPLPHTVTNGKTILYDPEEAEKWLANYKK